ncbi:hypothetical protein [Kitasatospora sp. HPMI-4]|uniref:hypothetical protein n=1 Tax=Kitasatospora sp. HPMI-4 TaxID=3448443 RepID=UPI003F1DC614
MTAKSAGRDRLPTSCRSGWPIRWPVPSPRLYPDGELLHRHLDLDGLAADATTDAARGRPLTFSALVTAAARPSTP